MTIIFGILVLAFLVVYLFVVSVKQSVCFAFLPVFFYFEPVAACSAHFVMM